MAQDWEHTGNKTGNTGNTFPIRDLPIAPFQAAALAFPVPHPILRPQTSRGTNFVCLRPLRLRLTDALLQDFRNCRGLFTLKPGPNDLFPGIPFVSSLLLVACESYQIERVEPPDRTRFESHFGFRPQLVAVTGQGVHIDLTTDDRPETAPSGFVTQIAAVVDGAGEDALAWVIPLGAYRKADGSGLWSGS